jgi:hypothetical protein
MYIGLMMVGALKYSRDSLVPEASVFEDIEKLKRQ